MHKSTERLALMEELQERGLGDVKKSPRRGLARARRRNSATIAAHAWPWPLGVSPAISFKPEWHSPHWQFVLFQAGRGGGRSVSWNAWCWKASLFLT